MGHRSKLELSIETIQMTEKHLKKCPTFLAIREMQIKTTLRFQLTPIRIAKISKEKIASAGRDVE